MLYSRIEAAASVAGAELLRTDDPAWVPVEPPPDLVLVDWASRADSWAATLRALRDAAPHARMILFGPHVDLAAHAAAREAGLGPMWARSRLLSTLPGLLAEAAATSAEG
jgi:DNA-binding NarL/FixJ family response regulator